MPAEDSNDGDESTVEEHHLTKEVVYHRREGRIPDGNGGLKDDGTGGSLLYYEEKKTMVCYCGERFRKDSTAIEHLRVVGALDE